MSKRSVTGRFCVIFLLIIALPAFAAAQHHGGGGFAAGPVAAGRSTAVIAHAPSARTIPAGHSGTRSAARFGTSTLRARNGVRTHNRNGANFTFNGTDFQNVPGLGFDYPHLAAISGNRRLHNGRFGAGVPFGFNGFLLGPSTFVDEVPVGDSQLVEAPSSAENQEVVEDAPPAQSRPRRSRSARQIEPEADSAPLPSREDDQYVFVRRDGSLVFAVAYAWESGTLRYITPEGLRRSIGREALDLDATQQFNEQRGLNFRAPV